jgi:hypothetical protein
MADRVRISLERLNRNRQRIGLPPLRQQDLGFVPPPVIEEAAPDAPPWPWWQWLMATFILSLIGCGLLALFAPRVPKPRPGLGVPATAPCGRRATPAPWAPSRASPPPPPESPDLRR